MFSNSKQTPARQDVFLQELSEEQLTQVAGGTCSSKGDKMDHNKHHHHHHHKHHQWHKTTTNKYNSDWKTTTSSSTVYGTSGSHW